MSVAVILNQWSTKISAALEASTVVKASAGALRSSVVRLDSTAGTATYYILVMNAASLPANGAVTMLTAPIKRIHTTGTDDYITYDFTDSPLVATTGIVIAVSSTEFTLTVEGAYLSTFSLYK